MLQKVQLANSNVAVWRYFHDSRPIPDHVRVPHPYNVRLFDMLPICDTAVTETDLCQTTKKHSEAWE